MFTVYQRNNVFAVGIRKTFEPTTRTELNLAKNWTFRNKTENLISNSKVTSVFLSSSLNKYNKLTTCNLKITYQNQIYEK